MRRQAVKVNGPENAVLETILVAVQVETHLRLDEGRAQLLIEAWRAMVPAGVMLGAGFHRTGDLLRLQNQSVSAAVMLDTLAANYEGSNKE